MHSVKDSRRATTIGGIARSSASSLCFILLLVGPLPPDLRAYAASAPTLKLAVFEFELDDVSAAGSAAAGDTASKMTRMHAVTDAARRVLAQSGRYRLIDPSGSDAQAVRDQSLRNCDGCDAGIARQLGAERSLIGVVTRVAQTEYYVFVRITDTSTGQVVNQEAAFFTGADDAWASGVTMLITHQVLPAANY
jgi:hypothetical protein